MAQAKKKQKKKAKKENITKIILMTGEETEEGLDEEDSDDVDESGMYRM